MNASLSAFIDACRVAAALVVLFGHLDALGFVSAQPAGWPNRAGHDAVVVFFVLSGLVIAHAAATVQRDARSYAVARASRIYSVAVPAVLIGFMLDRVGAQLDPIRYSNWQVERWPLHMAYQWLFLGESWTGSSVVPFSNVPYWSLAYEAWYYLLFGAALFLRGPARVIAVLAVLAAMGPKPWLLLPVWLAGVALHRLLARLPSADPAGARPVPTTNASIGPGRRRASAARAGALATAAVAAGLAAHALLVASGTQAMLDRSSKQWLTTIQAATGMAGHLGYSRFFLSDWLTATLFALVLLGVARLQPSVSPRAAMVASTLAGATFTLYLLHYPLLTLLHVSGAFAPPGGAAALGATAVVLAAAAACAWAFERRRGGWRRLFGAIWDRLSVRHAR